MRWIKHCGNGMVASILGDRQRQTDRKFLIFSEYNLLVIQIVRFLWPTWGPSGPTWVLSAPDGPHVSPMNLAIRGDSPHTLSSLMVLSTLPHSPLRYHHFSLNFCKSPYSRSSNTASAIRSLERDDIPDMRLLNLSVKFVVAGYGFRVATPFKYVPSHCICW